MFQTEHLQEKWSPVLAHPDLPKIEDAYKRAVTTLILENQEKALREDRAFLSEAAPENSTGTSIDNWDPILISLVRRSMPNLIAYDICGVQPMTGPTGLIFAMRSRKTSQTGAEMLADEAQQDEFETFRNLAQGGLIPDEKARELEENVRRRKALIEQNEQEFAEDNDELSWTELIDSETHKSSTAGKGGLPRIDL